MKSTLLAVIVAFIGGGPASAAVSVFPAPPGLEASPHYRVEVQTRGGWQPSFVNFNPARTDGTGASDQPGRSMSWTTFHANEPLRVRVTAATGSAQGVTIRPLRFGIEARPAGERSVEFGLAPGQKVSVEFSHAIRENCFTGPPYGIPCVMHALLVFADRAPALDELANYAGAEIARVAPGLHAVSRPVAGLAGREAQAATLGDAGGRRVVSFEPGVHDLGYWQVPNGVEHVHLAPGAVVFGALDVLPAGREQGVIDYDLTYRDGWPKEKLRREFRLTGAGILSGAKLPWHLKKDFSYHQDDHWWQHVKLLQLAVTNIIVRDVTLVDAPYWVLSFLNDTDTRSRGRFENFKIVGAWTYNNDGLPVPGGESVVRDAFIHANDDALKLYHSGARVEDCVIWQGNNGAVFQFGWFPKTVRGVRVRQVDVIHNENWYGAGLGNRATFNFADAGGAGVIEDVGFESVAIEGPILRLFGFRALGGQQLRNFRFKDLTVGALGAGQLGAPGRNYFFGDITDFRFDGFRIGNVAVKRPEDAWMEFGPDAGAGFMFDGNLVDQRPLPSVPEPKPTSAAVPPAKTTAATGVNLLKNPRFAEGATGWTMPNGLPVKVEVREGAAFARVLTHSSLAQDVSDALRTEGAGTFAYTSALQAATAPCSGKVTLVIEDPAGTQQHPSPDALADPAAWQEAGRTQAVFWTNLIRATLRVESGGPQPGELLVREARLKRQP